MYSDSTFTNAFFFARHPVFTVEEFTAANDRIKRESKHASLAYSRHAGKVVNVRRGIYAVVPEGIDPERYMVDVYQVAAKATGDAIIAYHSALALYGYAYSIRNLVTYLTAQPKTRKFRFQGTEYVGVKQPIALTKRKQENVLVETVDRGGLDARVTSLERTLVDCFDRLDLCGGIEEVWRSLETVQYFHIDRILKYVDLLNNSTTTAKVGLFLEANKERFKVTDRDLAFLRARRPHHASYMFRTQRTGKLVHNWNLIVPIVVLERSWEEPF